MSEGDKIIERGKGMVAVDFIAGKKVDLTPEQRENLNSLIEVLDLAISVLKKTADKLNREARWLSCREDLEFFLEIVGVKVGKSDLKGGLLVEIPKFESVVKLLKNGEIEKKVLTEAVAGLEDTIRKMLLIVNKHIENRGFHIPDSSQKLTSKNQAEKQSDFDNNGGLELRQIKNLVLEKVEKLDTSLNNFKELLSSY